MANYHVLFSGEIVEGANPEAVRRGLQRTLGIDERKAKQLFTGRTVVLRSQLSAAEAQSLVAVLSALGAVCRVKDYTPKPAANPARFKLDEKGIDRTLRDLTAAHVECPRCGNMQLMADYCLRCGIDIVAAQKRIRKEDALIEKKLKALREQHKPEPAAPTAASGVETGTKPSPASKMSGWFRKAK
ncbi:MAG: hypothetical protein H6993_00485 [Pseudomonadales bacterium]|nr:hypothetical protein [Pseudomonadales bacterium]MCP5182400.1 hypothetical protein [Pseudomonadales bacterium]